MVCKVDGNLQRDSRDWCMHSRIFNVSHFFHRIESVTLNLWNSETVAHDLNKTGPIDSKLVNMEFTMNPDLPTSFLPKTLLRKLDYFISLLGKLYHFIFSSSFTHAHVAALLFELFLSLYIAVCTSIFLVKMAANHNIA